MKQDFWVQELDVRMRIRYVTLFRVGLYTEDFEDVLGSNLTSNIAYGKELLDGGESLQLMSVRN